MKSLKRFIEKMKTKSELEKRTFAFFAAVIITLIIFLFWFVNTFYVFNNSDGLSSNPANPFIMLFDQMKSVINSSNIYSNQ